MQTSRIGRQKPDTLVIREAAPGDAEALHDLFGQLVTEADLDIPWTPEDYPGPDRILRMIERFATADNSLYLVAQAGDRLVGEMSLRGGSLRADRHSASLGISISRDWRGKGLGRAMIARGIDWARATGLLSRLELQVYATNERAVRLYESLGFEREGCRRKALSKNGVLVDDVMMALLL